MSPCGASLESGAARCEASWPSRANAEVTRRRVEEECTAIADAEKGSNCLAVHVGHALDRSHQASFDRGVDDRHLLRSRRTFDMLYCMTRTWTVNSFLMTKKVGTSSQCVQVFVRLGGPPDGGWRRSDEAVGQIKVVRGLPLLERATRWVLALHQFWKVRPLNTRDFSAIEGG